MLARKSVHVIPRSSSDALPTSSPVDVDLETLKSKFGMRLSDAAKSLGISMTSFKQVCRKLGVARWPRSQRPRPGAHNTGTVVAGSRKRPAEAMDPCTSFTIGSRAEINHTTFKRHIPPLGMMSTMGHSFQPISKLTTSPPVGATQNTLSQAGSPWHIPDLQHAFFPRRFVGSPATPDNGFSNIDAKCASAKQQHLSTAPAHSPTLNRHVSSRISTTSALQAPTASQTHSHQAAKKQAYPQRTAQAQSNAYSALKVRTVPHLLEQIEATEKHLACLKNLQVYLAFPSLGSLLCEKRLSLE